jgi:hypothetical protein
MPHPASVPCRGDLAAAIERRRAEPAFASFTENDAVREAALKIASRAGVGLLDLAGTCSGLLRRLNARHRLGGSGEKPSRVLADRSQIVALHNRMPHPISKRDGQLN